MNKFTAMFTTVVLLLAAILPAAKAAQELATDAKDVCPIKVGEMVPPLSAKDIDGRDFDLNKSIAQKPTILIFYRGSWCPYCNTHLGELKSIEDDLKKLGYQIIAISPDLPENLKKSVDKNDLEYQLLSDSKIAVAQALGLAFQVDDATYTKYMGYGINLEQASGEKHHALPVPAAIIVDTKGKVRFAFVSPDYTVRIDSRLLLAAAESSIN